LIFSKSSLSQTKSKFLNDTYNRNPIEILTPQQHEDFNQAQKDKNLVRTQRITTYMSSDLFKSTVGPGKGLTLDLSGPDKITNAPLLTVKNAHKLDPEPKKFVRGFKTYSGDSKRVFYV
jgi:hypothetical protein